MYPSGYAKYGVAVGGSESYNQNHPGAYNHWLGINPTGGFTYFKDVIINRDSGSPVEIVK